MAIKASTTIAATLLCEQTSHGMDETSLIRMFVDLTGDTEAAGRSVVMYLDMLERDYFPNADPLEFCNETGEGEVEPRPG